MAPISAPKQDQTKKLRVGFIHPDLGLGRRFSSSVAAQMLIPSSGGAERLVVDAAVSLQKRGHDVTIFTSRHDPTRCFEETRDSKSADNQV